MLFRLLAASATAWAFASPALAAAYDLVINRTDVQMKAGRRRVFSINGQIARTDAALEGGRGRDDQRHQSPHGRKPHPLARDHGAIAHGRRSMVNFDGIKPGTTFTYSFKVRQAGTYWYHSHSDGQEQEGMYAPIVIEPAKGERYQVAPNFRRDAQRPPSDVARHHPAQAEAGAGLLQRPPAYPARPVARSRRRPDETEERQAIISDRLMWSEMRMDPTSPTSRATPFW